MCHAVAVALFIRVQALLELREESRGVAKEDEGVEKGQRGKLRQGDQREGVNARCGMAVGGACDSFTFLLLCAISAQCTNRPDRMGS